MLSFLLDENVSPKVKKQLNKKHSGIIVHALQTWQQGRYLQAPDDLLLDVAYQNSLTLVTYDVSTIPNLLGSLALQNKNQAGVIFIYKKTIRPRDVEGVTQALLDLWEAENQRDWTNLTCALKKP